MKPWTSDKKWADGHDCLFTSIDFQGVIFGRCGHQPFSRPMSTLLFCSVCGYQFVVFWPVWPSALFPADVHVAVLFCLWLSICCLLAGVAISPFFVRCPRCCFVMSVIVNLLSFVRRVHQPVFRPMSTLLFCYVGDCQFVACLDACPSAHFLSDVHVAVCYVVDCQFVAFWPACPSARFPSDVHVAVLLCR